MKAYTISQVARMAGVSVRTLHHYDQIGLLVPSARTAAGYRLYGQEDLLRLQQILFFREFGLPLDEVRRILDDPGFDPVRALAQHRQTLQQRIVQLTRLLHTVDRTIQRLTEGTMTLTDEELYEGFTQEQIERYKREARETYDPALVEESEQRVRRMTKEQWQAIKAEGGEVLRSLAAMIDRDPAAPEVQALIARHYAWVNHFYTPTAEVYRGLGRLYVEHPEFRATHERIRPGLAEFMAAAMAHYADEVLADKSCPSP